ncbi:hypothetical protein J6590_032739 [Homalodisca vitripennis]|nr:hypothetical protein J6590_032739 [Homalodisca vitripennis]
MVCKANLKVKEWFHVERGAASDTLKIDVSTTDNVIDLCLSWVSDFWSFARDSLCNRVYFNKITHLFISFSIPIIYRISHSRKFEKKADSSAFTHFPSPRWSSGTMEFVSVCGPSRSTHCDTGLRPPLSQPLCHVKFSGQPLLNWSWLWPWLWLIDGSIRQRTNYQLINTTCPPSGRILLTH